MRPFGSLRGYRRGLFCAALTVLTLLLLTSLFEELPEATLAAGIAISMLLLVYRVSRPHVAVLGLVPGTADQYGDVERHAENVPPDGIAVLRVESGLLFANAEHVRATVRAETFPGMRAIVLDFETVPYVDVSAARMLRELAGDLERDGIALVIARDIGQVRDVMERADPGDPKAIPTYRTVGEAVAALGGAGRVGASVR